MLYSKLCWKALWCCAAALSFLSLSCSNTFEFYRGVDESISMRNYLSAINEVRENRHIFGDKSSVLYNLDMGLLNHYAGEYDSSISYFFAAEKEIEDLYTKSISQQVLSFVLNDNIIPYDGEDFEKVLINIFLALNFAQKGMNDDALVEARKVDLKLREYARKYEEKNTYKEDAFIRYISGVLYESNGEINDAFISYRQAYEAYDVYSKEYGTPAPSFILDDLVRTAALLSFTDEVSRYQSLGGQPYINGATPDGSLLVLTYTGKGPIKKQERPTVSIPDSSGVLHTFQIALPKFIPRYSGNTRYDVAAISHSDTITTATELAENITAIAEKSLNDRLAMIYLKSGGRALLKFLASEKMKSEMKKDKNETKNFLGSLAIDLVVGATEQADLRTWRTLPAQIHIARLNLPPGEYILRVNESGKNSYLKVDSVNVHPGKTSFIIVVDIR
jgi:hypothetical protein